MRTCLQDDVRGSTDRSSCCQNIVHDNDCPVAQLVGRSGRKSEHTIKILEAFNIRQLCLERCVTGLEQKSSAAVAVEARGECSACHVGEVTLVSLVPGTEPRNRDKDRAVSQWKRFCEGRQHAGKLSGQLIFTLYLHLQYGLSQ